MLKRLKIDISLSDEMSRAVDILKGELGIETDSEIVRFALKRAAKTFSETYASPPNKIAALPAIKAPYLPVKKNPEHFVPDWEVGEEEKVNPYKGWRKIEQGENSTDGYEYITLKEQIKPWRVVVIKNGDEWFNENK